MCLAAKPGGQATRGAGFPRKSLWGSRPGTTRRLTYRHTAPGAMGYGRVRPGHNPFDPDRLFVRIGAGLEVGFEGDTLRAGGGAACPPATSSPATTPA